MCWQACSSGARLRRSAHRRPAPVPLAQNALTRDVFSQLRTISSQQSKIREMKNKLALFRWDLRVWEVGWLRVRLRPGVRQPGPGPSCRQASA